MSAEAEVKELLTLARRMALLDTDALDEAIGLAKKNIPAGDEPRFVKMRADLEVAWLVLEYTKAYAHLLTKAMLEHRKKIIHAEAVEDALKIVDNAMKR